MSSSMPFAAVAWDIDGTIVDSEPLHHRALLAACSSFGCDLTDHPQDSYRGVPMAEAWNDLLPHLPAHLEQTDWLAEIQDYYITRQNELVEIAGAHKVLRELNARRIRHACVPNSVRKIVDVNLTTLGISEMFEFLISTDDVIAGKLAPDSYSQAIACFGLPARYVLAIEDSQSAASGRDLKELPRLLFSSD